MFPQPATRALARPTMLRWNMRAVHAWLQTNVAPKMPVQALVVLDVGVWEVAGVRWMDGWAYFIH